MSQAHLRTQRETQKASERVAVAKLASRVDRDKVMVPLWRRAREYTDEALETLVMIMRDRNAPYGVRAVCAEAILDRGHGKAPQVVAADVAVRHEVDLSGLGTEALASLESVLMGLALPMPEGHSAARIGVVEGEAVEVGEKERAPTVSVEALEG